MQKHPRLCLRSQRGTRPTIPLLKSFVTLQSCCAARSGPLKLREKYALITATAILETDFQANLLVFLHLGIINFSEASQGMNYKSLTITL